MLKEEFEKLINGKVENGDYYKIESVYCEYDMFNSHQKIADEYLKNRMENINYLYRLMGKKYRPVPYKERRYTHFDAVEQSNHADSYRYLYLQEKTDKDQWLKAYLHELDENKDLKRKLDKIKVLINQ
jgi:hypothetical protein